MIKDKKAHKAMSKGRAALVLDQPFFGSVALRLQLTEDLSCPTAWVDGRSLGYNPGFIESLTPAKITGLIAHEVMHVAMAHHARRQKRDPQNWNIAGDHAINGILTESGFSLPDGALKGMDPSLSTEVIYGTLKTPENEQGQKQDEGQGDGSGTDESGDGGGAQDGQDGEPGQGQGQDQDGENSDPGQCGEVRDYPGEDGKKASAADMKKAEEEAKVMTAQAAQQAKAIGDLPGGLKRLVDEILNPKISWTEVLRRFVETAAKNDYAWNPPNRRFVYQNIYLPSLRSNDLGEVVIAVDTSGSISSKEVNQFASEISAILEEFDAHITVIYCDTEVANVEEFTKADLPLQFNLKGGGGTDFRPPFDYVNKSGLIPTCMIYLTDLECHSYPLEPDYPVIWAFTGSYGRTDPPFGEVIEVK